MTSFNFSEIGKQLENANEKSESTGVSFAGKSLKLNSEEDAKEVVEAIEKCERLEYLDLNGNTLGPKAAKGIAKALEKHGAHLKRALWKDMFTGRMKDEIPLALQYLGEGLCTAGTKLVELDLSDNAFGPIGIKGLASLLSSSSCYTLQELRLNNNGLGISGGKMLAKALLDCHEKSMKAGTPLALKVFIAGRNRLENEGATALASVFQTLKSLEEVVMPQNGIYHAGISALAGGLSANPGLRILNLNDNTVGLKGALALAQVLPNFTNLEHLNLGDCLLKTKGAIVLAEALSLRGCALPLTELNLTFNEIRSAAVEPIAGAMSNKTQLTSLKLDGNYFGNEGRDSLTECLTRIEKIDSLETLSEDATDDESEEEDAESEEEESDENNEEQEEDSETECNQKLANVEVKKSVTVKEFLKAPTGENLLLLKQQENKAQDFVEHAKGLAENDDTVFIEKLTLIIMKVSSLCGSGYMEVRIHAESLTDDLYSELFSRAERTNQTSVLNNSLLVNLGLLKGEDKTSGKIDWNLEGCFKALEKVIQKSFFLPQTKDTLRLFIDKPVKLSRARVVDPLQDAKACLKAALDRIQVT